MPEGSFAVAETARKTSAKKDKSLAEEQFLELCRDTIAAEQAWAAIISKSSVYVRDADAPADLIAERDRLAKLSGEGYRRITKIPAPTAVGLRAKAQAILVGYHDDAPEDHEGLYSVVKDAAAFPLVAPVAIMNSGDRQIIKLVDEFKENRTKFGALEEVIEAHGYDSAKGKKASTSVRRIVTRNHTIREVISGIVAQSRDALLAKAWLAKWETSDGDVNGQPRAHGDLVAWSLARDILSGSAPLSLSLPHNADAILLALCEEWQEANYQYKTLTDEANSLDVSTPGNTASKARRIDAKRDKLTAKLTSDLPDKIMKTRAKTPSGARAKALVVEGLIQGNEGFCIDDYTLHLVSTIADDLRHMADHSGPHPDAELIRICGEFCETERKYRALFDDGGPVTDDELNIATKPIDRAWASGIAQMKRIRARTLDGILARAAALREHEEGDPSVGPEAFMSSGYINEGLMGQLLRDLYAMIPSHGGKPLVSDHAREIPSADDGLVKACAEHIVNHCEFNAYDGDLEPDANPLWQAYMATLDAISDTPATTLAGLVAKARAIKTEARQPDGEDFPEEVVPWMWDLVNDLVRMGGEDKA